MSKNKQIILLIKILLLSILILNYKKNYLASIYFLIDYYYFNKIRIIGKKNIPKNNGYVIMSNHNFASEALIIKNIIKNLNVVANDSISLKFIDYNNLLIFYKRDKHIKKMVKL